MNAVVLAKEAIGKKWCPKILGAFFTIGNEWMCILALHKLQVNVGLSRKRSSLSKRSRSSHDAMLARRSQSNMNLSPAGAVPKSLSAHDRLMSTPIIAPEPPQLPEFDQSPVVNVEVEYFILNLVIIEKHCKVSGA